MVVVYDGSLPDEAIKKELESVKGFLEEHAELENENVWGKRQLAYEIKRKKTGYYVLYQFGGESSVPAAIEKRFKLDAAVLRYLVIVRDTRKNVGPLPVEEERPESDEHPRDRRRRGFRGGRPERSEQPERKPAEQSPAEKPSAEKPAAEKPAAEQPPAEKPVEQAERKPVGETAVEKPVEEAAEKQPEAESPEKQESAKKGEE